jgi:hypothetical protein
MINVSHNAFSGNHMQFDRFRSALAAATGGGFGNESFFTGDDYSQETHPGLWALFAHEDSGEFSTYEAALMADEIQDLLPKIDGIGGGRKPRPGPYVAMAQKWITGCRVAAALGEPLKFL